MLLVSFDEHGGTYDHVVPPRADPPCPAAPAGQTGHVPSIDPRTASGEQARDYMTDRIARIFPGLATQPA